MKSAKVLGRKCIERRMFTRKVEVLAGNLGSCVSKVMGNTSLELIPQLFLRAADMEFEIEGK